jgi:nucleoid-associated protein YgaU
MIMVNPIQVSGSERLPVTLLSVGERTAAVLEAYFSGPGRSVFSPAPESAAMVAIADLDNPASMADLKRFQLQSNCPVIVLAMSDPMLPGTVWVNKPASPVKLQEAAVTVRRLLQEANHPPEPSPGAVVDQPVEPVPALVPEPVEAPVASAAPVSSPASAPVSAPTPAPDLASMYAQHPDAGRRRIPLLLGGLSLISVAVVGVVLLRPSGEGSSPGAASVTRTVAAPVEPELQSAVASSLHDVQVQTESDKAFIEAQRAQLQPKESEEDVKARLDRLAADPAALAAYNRSVMNKVHVTGNGGIAAPERSVRGEIEAILSDAAVSGTASSDRFATSLQPEAKQHEAEMRTIVVQRGDTLSSIALRAYGDQAKYPLIFEANPRILTSPNHIFPGQVLRVPNT